MSKPKIGDVFSAFFGGKYEKSTVVEWIGNKCVFANGWYLTWGGEHVGFKL